MITRDAVRQIRRFNRFYTRRLRLLDQRHLDSPFPLSQVRVLYELDQRTDPSARDIGEALQLDAGYLSRLLGLLRRRGLVQATPGRDRRQHVLSLTPKGRAVFAGLDRSAGNQVKEMVRPLPAGQVERLLGAMGEIEELLRDEPAGPGAPERRIQLRAPAPGDLGWVVQRHGEIYDQEYGWNEEFEGLVAGIVGQFGAGKGRARERCWIALVDGRRAGCIFLTYRSDRVARLRLLLVEPWARGLGLGGRLVSACVGAARALGYAKLTLWTNSVLHGARRLYEAGGFVLVRSEPHHSFGHDLVGETWDLAL